MAAIKKQVEYYFSDSNWRHDKFLKSAAEKDDEGFVPISVLLTFNKLKALCDDAAAVAAAVKDSQTVTVSEDGQKLKRTRALPEEDDSQARSLYAKGFPTDDEGVTIESLSGLFSEWGTVLRVQLRKDMSTKKFKGGCFVEFADVASMEKCVKAMNAAGTEEKPEISYEYKGTKLLCVLPKTEWAVRHKAKLEKKKAFKKEKEAKKGGEKRKREDDDEAAKAKVEFTKGCVVQITGKFGDSSVNSLKELFGKYGEGPLGLRFVEFEEGASEAVVRFGSSEAAAAAATALGGGEVKVDEEEALVGSVISGDDEEAYWKRYSEQVAESNKKQRQGGKGGRGGRGGGGRGRGKGGRGGKRQDRDF